MWFEPFIIIKEVVTKWDFCRRIKKTNTEMRRLVLEAGWNHLKRCRLFALWCKNPLTNISIGCHRPGWQVFPWLAGGTISKLCHATNLGCVCACSGACWSTIHTVSYPAHWACRLVNSHVNHFQCKDLDAVPPSASEGHATCSRWRWS